MSQFSNCLLGCLNLFAFLSYIPILVAGISLTSAGNCFIGFDKPLITLGVFLMGSSLLRLVSAWYGNSLLLWIYLVVMSLLIVLFFIFILFAFAVTRKRAGVALAGQAYKEYRLGDYSRWLQNRVIDQRNWNKIKSRLQSHEFCFDYLRKYVEDDMNELSAEKLSALQV